MDDKDDLFGFPDGGAQGGGTNAPQENYNGNFQPTQPTTGYNPQMPYGDAYARTRRRDPSVKVLYVILAVFASVFLFFAGFLTSHLTQSPESQMYEWALDQIETYYIGDEIEGVHYTRDDYVRQGFSLLDRYSGLLLPAEYAAATQSQHGAEHGLGVSIRTETIDGRNEIVVADVAWNSPAEGKIFTGDIIYKINGVTADADNYAESVSAALTGGTETFTLKRPVYNTDNDMLEYSEVSVQVAAGTYNASYLRYADGFSNDLAAVLPPETAYIEFRQFNEPAGAELVEAMKKYSERGMKNLILDLRNNPGGYLDIATVFAGYLASDGSGTPVKVMDTEFKDKSRLKYVAEGTQYDNYIFDKIVVLVNGNSASASEVLLGCMKDYGTVDRIIGTTTYGKGIMQITLPHDRSGYALTLTAGKWYTPNGTWVHKAEGGTYGIVPDVTVEANSKNYPYTYAGDAELSAAIAYINS